MIGNNTGHFYSLRRIINFFTEIWNLNTIDPILNLSEDVQETPRGHTDVMCAESCRTSFPRSFPFPVEDGYLPSMNYLHFCTNKS